MKTLLVIFLIIDLFVTFITYREAFVARSNKNRQYQQRFFMLTAIIAAAIGVSFYDTGYACLIAGLPAITAVGFALLMFLAVIMRKDPWR